MKVAALVLVLLTAVLVPISCGGKEPTHPDNPDPTQTGDGGPLPPVPAVPSN